MDVQVSKYKMVEHLKDEGNLINHSSKDLLWIISLFFFSCNRNALTIHTVIIPCPLKNNIQVNSILRFRNL